MKVSVAAKLLSRTVAASIETFVSTSNLLSEAVHTAEFIHMIDNLFDSLNSSNLIHIDGKKFKRALTKNSPHLKFWSELLQKMRNWKIVDQRTSSQCKYHKFVQGWQITIRVVICLWENLSSKGFEYLCLRNLNNDPIENCFCKIRQHGVSNTNPTCHQFTAALKTVIINNFDGSFIENSNCEQDDPQCVGLGDLLSFLNNEKTVDLTTNNLDDTEEDFVNNFNLNHQETNFAASYVAGYILKKIKISDCSYCKSLFATDPDESHLFIQFKEYDDSTRLLYPSKEVVNFIEEIHSKLYTFLEKHGHELNIETRFKTCFKSQVVSTFCIHHDIQNSILDKTVRLVIYQYLKEKRNMKTISDGHNRKIKRFKSLG